MGAIAAFIGENWGSRSAPATQQLPHRAESNQEFLSKKGYFAGGLFCNKDLFGNVDLAQAILDISEKRYISVLPQNLEQRETTPSSIRNNDLLALAKCDFAMFFMDGTELDSGTVVEYEFAKYLDIPCVLVRSDLRAAGDSQDLPWNLMIRPSPRAEAIVFDAMSLYQSNLSAQKGDASLSENELMHLLTSSFNAAQRMHIDMAKAIVSALDRVTKIEPVLDLESFKAALTNKSKLTGDGFEAYLGKDVIEEIVARREQLQKNLIPLH